MKTFKKHLNTVAFQLFVMGGAILAFGFISTAFYYLLLVKLQITNILFLSFLPGMVIPALAAVIFIPVIKWHSNLLNKSIIFE